MSTVSGSGSSDTTNPRWKITILPNPQPKPFDHKFQLEALQCECTPWVARSLQAAFRLVDMLEFHAAHPELPAPEGSVAIHVRHQHSGVVQP